MGNSFKNTWWIFLLVAAGGVIFFLSLQPHKIQGDGGVALKDISHRKVDPVPPMAIVTSLVDGHEAGFAIQVYSFQDANRAQAALQSLKNRGYQAFLVVSDLGEKGVFHRVRVGGIADEASARKMLEEIRKNYNSGFILKLPK